MFCTGSKPLNTVADVGAVLACRIMKQQGQAVDEVVCFILLRLCFNCLRDAWLPGGYPPKKDAFKVLLVAPLAPVSSVWAAIQQGFSIRPPNLTQRVTVQWLQREPPVAHRLVEP